MPELECICLRGPRDSLTCCNTQRLTFVEGVVNILGVERTLLTLGGSHATPKTVATLMVVLRWQRPKNRITRSTGPGIVFGVQTMAEWNHPE